MLGRYPLLCRAPQTESERERAARNLQKAALQSLTKTTSSLKTEEAKPYFRSTQSEHNWNAVKAYFEPGREALEQQGEVLSGPAYLALVVDVCVQSQAGRRHNRWITDSWHPGACVGGHARRLGAVCPGNRVSLCPSGAPRPIGGTDITDREKVVMDRQG